MIQYHLKQANDGNEITKDELYSFLKHFHIINYDIRNEQSSTILSLLLTHISQFKINKPYPILTQIESIVQTFNYNSGILSPEHEQLKNISENFKLKPPIEKPVILVLICLIGKKFLFFVIY